MVNCKIASIREKITEEFIFSVLPFVLENDWDKVKEMFLHFIKKWENVKVEVIENARRGETE